MHSIFSHYYAHKRDYLKSSPPQQHKGRQNTSAATLVLLKLDEILPLYCAQLAASNFDQCCKILDTHASAPFGPVRAEAPCEPYCGTPPSGKSPIRTWLAGASGDSTQHNHLPFVSILKSNLDIFFTLAGAESLYSSLSHSLSAKFAQIVVSSYGEVIAALQHARESLCDAILSDNREASPYLEKARNLATTLNFIIFFPRQDHEVFKCSLLFGITRNQISQSSGLSLLRSTRKFRTVLPILSYFANRSNRSYMHGKICAGRPSLYNTAGTSSMVIFYLAAMYCEYLSYHNESSLQSVSRRECEMHTKALNVVTPQNTLSRRPC